MAPAGSEDHHDTDWGAESLPKTVLIARSNQPEDLKEAMLARRMYAVAQKFNFLEVKWDAQLGESAPLTYPMGSRIAQPEGTPVTLSLDVKNLAAAQTGPYAIEVFSSAADNEETYQPLMRASTDEKGQVEFNLSVAQASHWYFARILLGEQIVAATAPIWLMPADAELPACAPLPSY